MVSKEELLICHFETDKNCGQIFFNEILKSALSYKYKDAKNSAIPVTKKDITNAIFSLSAKDRITLFGKAINGQKIKELFIAAVYLRYLDLDLINRGKMILVSIPFKEESYDVAIFITEKKNFKIDGNKCQLPKHSIAYYIQIKEEFDYKAYKNDDKAPKKGLNIKSLEKKSSSYNELVLIFMRDFCIFNSDEAESFLKKNINVGLINMPSLEQKEITITGGRDMGKKIILDEKKYNFFLLSENQTAHIKFDVPNFLIPKV